MSVVPYLFAVGASASLFASGYLFGIRRDKSLRAALQAETARIAEGAVGSAGELTRLREDLQIAVRTLAHRDEEQHALREELAEVRREALSFTPPPKDFSLAPVPETNTDPIHRSLGQALRARTWTLRDLSDLLECIARETGLTNIVLADDAGLALGSSLGTRNVDAIAATAALVLLQLERSEGFGGARPIACVVLDDDHGQTVHRLFRVGPPGGTDRGSRFTLSGFARGFEPSPAVLDGALPTLDQMLARDG